MKNVLAAWLCMAALASAAFGQNTNFFHTSGQGIVAPDGSAFVIRGNAPSAWLTPESYALKLDTVWGRPIGSYSDIKSRISIILSNSANEQAFWNTYQSNYFTAADVADLKAEGFNTIRLPVNYRMLQDWCCTGTWNNAGFQLISNVVDWCRSNGMYLMIDLHCAPGGQSADPPADPEQTYWSYDSGISNWVEVGVACLWESNSTYYANTGRTPEWNQQRTIAVWTEIANRFKDETQILGYDLINEPYLPWGVDGPVLRSLLTNITAAIRSVDANHMLIAEDNFFAGTMENMSPVWDSNMMLMFHKYWRPTQLSEIQQYIDVATSNNVPLVMGESGENSSPWFYEFKNLLESNNIGWCWWGWKKVDAITAALSCPISTNYQYVINNFRDSPIDGGRAYQGLMDMANSMKTTNCVFDPGWYDALLGSSFGTTPSAFVNTTVPGRIYAANYDIGNQAVAYSDTRYKNEDNWNGAPWNYGWSYRNDGVDIYKDTDAQNFGFHVGSTDNGEWLKYTVTAQTSGSFRTAFRVATSGGQLQVLDGTNALTAPVTINNTGGFGNWKTQTNSSLVTLAAGLHVLQLSVITGGVDVAWIDFAYVPPASAAAPTFSPNGGTFTNSVNVTLSSATPGATIYYTTDGTTPNAGSSSVASGNSISLSQPYANNVKAFASAAGYSDSAVSTSAAFSVVPMPTASAPTFSPNGGTYTNSVSVTLSSSTPGATIYYTTDGSAPSTSSSSVASGNSITLTQPYANSVKAFVQASGYLDSAIATSTAFSVVAMPVASAPTYSPNGGTFTNSVNVTLSSSTPGATIYYTTDGSAPSTSSSSVASGNSITLTQPYANSVRAFAQAGGYADSAISTSTAFSVVAPPAASAPTYSPNGGTYSGSVSVVLSSTTPGSTIYYTTNGTAPTTNSSSVANGNSIALVAPATNTLRAFAKASGYVNSSISTSAVFTVVTATAAVPTYSPNGGTYSGSVSVVLSSTTPGSTIYYTTNGTAPTTNSSSVASGNSITLSMPYTNNVRAIAKASGYVNSAISTSSQFKVVAPVPQLLNGAVSGSGTAPTSWLAWNDNQHDPDTGTFRSSANSWAFWYDGGIYQDITNGFVVGQSVTFGGYLRHPSTDALRNGTKYGIIQLEFRTSSDTLISTASTAQINSSSAKDSWLSRSATATVPSGTAKLRIVVRCNNFTSGDGKFFADDLFIQ